MRCRFFRRNACITYPSTQCLRSGVRQSSVAVYNYCHFENAERSATKTCETLLSHTSNNWRFGDGRELQERLNLLWAAAIMAFIIQVQSLCRWVCRACPVQSGVNMTGVRTTLNPSLTLIQLLVTKYSCNYDRVH